MYQQRRPGPGRLQRLTRPRIPTQRIKLSALVHPSAPIIIDRCEEGCDLRHERRGRSGRRGRTGRSCDGRRQWRHRALTHCKQSSTEATTSCQRRRRTRAGTSASRPPSICSLAVPPPIARAPRLHHRLHHRLHSRLLPPHFLTLPRLPHWRHPRPLLIRPPYLHLHLQLHLGFCDLHARAGQANRRLLIVVTLSVAIAIVGRRGRRVGGRWNRVGRKHGRKGDRPESSRPKRISMLNTKWKGTSSIRAYARSHLRSPGGPMTVRGRMAAAER